MVPRALSRSAPRNFQFKCQESSIGCEKLAHLQSIENKCKCTSNNLNPSVGSRPLDCNHENKLIQLWPTRRCDNMRLKDVLILYHFDNIEFRGGVIIKIFSLPIKALQTLHSYNIQCKLIALPTK